MWKVCVPLLLLTSWRLSPSVACTPGVPLIWKHVSFNCHVFDLSDLAPNLCFFGKLPFTWQARGNCIEELWKVMDHPRRIVAIAQDVQQVGWWHEVETWERLLLRHKKEENVSLSLGKCSKEILQCPSTCVPWSSNQKSCQQIYPAIVSISHLAPFNYPGLTFAIHEFVQSLFAHQQLLLRLFLGAPSSPSQQLPWAMPLPHQIHGSINPPNCTSFSKVPGSGKYLSFTVFVAS